MNAEVDSDDQAFEEQQAKDSEQAMALDERDAEEQRAEEEMFQRSSGAAHGCAADSSWGANGDPWSQSKSKSSQHTVPDLSLIHISEPTRH
eukprot:7760256-Karenia_brevis.AAC.1